MKIIVLIASTEPRGILAVKNVGQGLCKTYKEQLPPAVFPSRCNYAKDPRIDDEPCLPEKKLLSLLFRKIWGLQRNTFCMPS